MPTIEATRPTTTMTISEVCVPRMTRANTSRPASSCPNGCSPIAKPDPPSQVGRVIVGEPPGLVSVPVWFGVKDHQPGMGPTPIDVKASRTMPMSTTIAPTAARCRKNRRRTIWFCESPSTSLSSMAFSTTSSAGVSSRVPRGVGDGGVLMRSPGFVGRVRHR